MEWEKLKTASRELMSGKLISISTEDFVAMVTHLRSPDGESSGSHASEACQISKFQPTSTELLLLKLNVFSCFYEQKAVCCQQQWNHVATLLHQNTTLHESILHLLDHSDMFVSYSASRCIMLMLKDFCQNRPSAFLDLFLSNLTERFSDRHLSNTLDICADFLQFCRSQLPSSGPDSGAYRSAAGVMVEKVGRLWNWLNTRTSNGESPGPLLSQYTLWATMLQMIADQRSDGCIIGTNWKELLSVITHFDAIFDKFRSTSDPIIWRHGVSVLNKAIGFRNIITTGKEGQEYLVFVARSVIQTMVVNGLMYHVPIRVGFVGFGGTKVLSCEEMGREELAGDRTMLKKTVILILRSVAVLCSQSSDDAEDLSKAFESLQASMDLTLRYASMPASDWPIALFEDQDDLLIEALLCLLIVTKRLSSKKSNADFRNAHHCFQGLLRIVCFDNNVLLDFILSPETCFLVYFTKYLHFVNQDWDYFCESLNSVSETKISDISDTSASDNETLCFSGSKNVQRCDGVLPMVDVSSCSPRNSSTCLVSYSDSEDSDDCSREQNHSTNPLSKNGPLHSSDSPVVMETHIDKTSNPKHGAKGDFVILSNLAEPSCTKCELQTSPHATGSGLDTKSEPKECADLDMKSSTNAANGVELSSELSINNSASQLANLRKVHWNDNVYEDPLDKCCEMQGIECDTETAEDSLLDKTMAVFIRIRISLEKVSANNLSPFNVIPLISLLETCEEHYDE